MYVFSTVRDDFWTICLSLLSLILRKWNRRYIEKRWWANGSNSPSHTPLSTYHRPDEQMVYFLFPFVFKCFKWIAMRYTTTSCSWLTFGQYKVSTPSPPFNSPKYISHHQSLLSLCPPPPTSHSQKQPASVFKGRLGPPEPLSLEKGTANKGQSFSSNFVWEEAEYCMCWAQWPVCGILRENDKHKHLCFLRFPAPVVSKVPGKALRGSATDGNVGSIPAITPAPAFCERGAVYVQ